MTRTLIERLNANLGKTPDQIVTVLSTKWFKGSDLTQDQFDYLRQGDGTVRLAIEPTWPGNPWWVSDLDQDYTVQGWGLRGMQTGLGSYWFIRVEEFRDGQFPDL